MILARAVIVSALFIGVLLLWVPWRILGSTGFVQPAQLGLVEFAGAALAACGVSLALWCIGTFVMRGQGTPAPFDPPRRLVVRGPYRFVRNPMYLGATLGLAGAAVCFRSWALFAYAVGFLLAM